jgi:hypothetical protein
MLNLQKIKLCTTSCSTGTSIFPIYHTFVWRMTYAKNSHNFLMHFFLPSLLMKAHRVFLKYELNQCVYCILILIFQAFSSPLSLTLHTHTHTHTYVYYIHVWTVQQWQKCWNYSVRRCRYYLMHMMLIFTPNKYFPIFIHTQYYIVFVRKVAVPLGYNT